MHDDQFVEGRTVKHQACCSSQGLLSEDRTQSQHKDYQLQKETKLRCIHVHGENKFIATDKNLFSSINTNNNNNNESLCTPSKPQISELIIPETPGLRQVLCILGPCTNYS